MLSALNKVYPPQELAQRNAMSRTDGYWKYIAKGEEPPPTLTYGEFDFLFFCVLIDRAMHMHNGEMVGSCDFSEKTFLDIGSGTGRLVLGAAALHPELKLCKGLEILPGIHEAALGNLDLCKTAGFSYSEHSNENLPMAAIQLTCGSFDDPYEYLGDADVIFVFSTCFTADMMSSLSDAIGRQCKPGTIVITTEYKLDQSGVIDPLENDPEMLCGDYNIEIVDSVDGWNWLVGGQSTAHIQRVKKSLWDGKGPRTRPYICPEVEAVNEAKEALKAVSGRQLTFEEFLKSQ